MGKVRIFVITHKVFERQVRDIIYEPLVVGANYNVIEYENRDNVGENISDKNLFYCELTGQYWIWKNVSCEIVGITHYRRYFFKGKHIVRENEIRNILQKNDVIISKKHYLLDSIYNIYENSNLKIYMKELTEILRTKFPEYYITFNQVLKKNYTYPCNMLICKKEIFDEYSNWLFNVLFELEDRVKKNDKIIDVPRAYGYLSENMLITYLLTKKYNIANLPIYNTEKNILYQKLENLFNGILVKIRKIKRRK